MMLIYLVSILFILIFLILALSLPWKVKNGDFVKLGLVWSLMRYAVRRSRADTLRWRKFVARLALPMLVCSISACGGVAIVADGISKNAKYRADADKYYRNLAEEERKWQSSSFRAAACGTDHALFEKELHSGVYDKTYKQRALKDCLIPKSDVAGLRSILLDLSPKDQGKTTTFAYCDYLRPVLVSLDVRLIEVFVEQNLSLNCQLTAFLAEQPRKLAENEEPSWWDMLGKSTAPGGIILTALKYLQAHGVDLKRHVDGRSLLLLAVEHENFAAIHFALDLGLDPNERNFYGRDLSPAQTWVLQRFRDVNKPSRSTAEWQSVQARLGEMTPRQAEFMALKLHRKVNLDMLANGGADMLAYLIQRGASLRKLNRNGSLIFGNTRLSPEVLAVLNQLSDTQLAEFICAEHDKEGDAYPLFAKAIEEKNQPLITLLTQRKMPLTCPIM